MMKQHDISHLIPGRLDWPLVVLALGPEERILQPVLRLAHARQWRLLDLRYRDGDLRRDLRPRGALVNALPTDPFVRSLLKRGCAVVRFGTLPFAKTTRVSAVMPDWGAVGRMAAQHFAERGFRHVGYIGHTRPLAGRQKAQYDGLKAGAAQWGCECHLFEGCSAAGHDPAEKYRERRAIVTAWLKTLPKPLGLLAFVDGFGATLCSMCEDVGIAVPEEVAVLGVGNILECCECSPLRLSSIVLDHEREAETAVQMLQRLMDGKRVAPTTAMIPPKGIITRESTDVLAATDPVVVRAVRYMWDHLHSHLSVRDVARQVGISRRRLERLFRRDLDRGVNQELLRRRLERSRELLRGTDDPIANLSAVLGFGSKDYFHRAFRKAFGTSPGKYRRERGGGQGGGR